MQSFLIISKDREKAKKYVLDFAKTQNVSVFDIYTLETEKTLGIGEVKRLSSQIFLKPQYGDKKIIVVEAFFGATTEAQNSFLKVLEEPPFSTFIFILALENYFLPTINSRVKVEKLDEAYRLSKDDAKEYSEILDNLAIKGIGYKLKIAQDYSKDKQNALDFLEKLIICARDKMVNTEKDRLKYKNEIEIIQRYYKQIKESNVNLRLALENLFLEFD